MSARTTIARPLARAWRQLPVRGGGRVLGPLVLDRQPAPVTTTTWAGGPLAVSFENPPEASVWLWNDYEPDVIAALEALVKPGQTAIDIGANCGVITMKMRELVGATGAVLAVDPSRESTDRVEEQARLRGASNVTTANVGLGNTETTAVFHVAGTGIGALPSEDREFGRAEQVDVRIRRLDDVVAEAGMRPSVIKIDTDGSELDILEGAARILKDDRPALVFELCVDGLERRGRRVEDLEAHLHGAGYELWAPTFAPHPSWRVDPPTVSGFRQVASFAAAGADVPNFVAIDPLVHRDWQAARR